MSEGTITRYINENNLQNNEITRAFVEAELYGSAILSYKENIIQFQKEVREVTTKMTDKNLLEINKINEEVQRKAINGEWHQYDWEYDCGEGARNLIIEEQYMELVDRNLI